MVFALLHYSKTLVEKTIRHFIEMKVTENVLNSKSDPMNKMFPSELSYRSKTTNSTQIGKCGKTPIRWSQSKKIMSLSSLFTQVRRAEDNSNKRNINLQLWINKTLFIITSVVCATRSMSASRVDTYASTCGGTWTPINNRKPRKGWTRKGWKGDHWKQFSETMSE